MTKFKKTIFSLAATGFLVTVAPGAAQAVVMASAVATISDFTISAIESATPLDAAAFSFLTYTSTGGYAGTLPGTSGYNASSAVIPVNLPAVCVGDGCVAWGAAYGAEDSFTNLAAPPVGNYSAADQAESGAPITGLSGLSAPASIANAAYAGLTTQSALSHSTSTNNLNSSFVFQLAAAGAVTFAFDFSAYLQTYVTNDETFPAFANASFSQQFTLVNLTTNQTVFSFTPDPFGINTISLNAPLPVTIEQIRDTGGPIFYSANTQVLDSTSLYQLSARTTANADVQRLPVPEPSILALLGVGLLGLGGTGKLRRNRA